MVGETLCFVGAAILNGSEEIAANRNPPSLSRGWATGGGGRGLVNRVKR